MRARAAGGARPRNHAVARRQAALGEKTLRFNDTRGQRGRLLFLLGGGCCLYSRNRTLRDHCRAKPELHEQPRGERHAGPCVAACVLPGVVDSFLRPAARNRAHTLRIEHWIRHALPKSDSGVPCRGNLPMGMSEESIG